MVLEVKYNDQKHFLSKLLGKHGHKLTNLKCLNSDYLREGLQPITALLPLSPEGTLLA